MFLKLPFSAFVFAIKEWNKKLYVSCVADWLEPALLQADNKIVNPPSNWSCGKIYVYWFDLEKIVNKNNKVVLRYLMERDDKAEERFGSLKIKKKELQYNSYVKKFIVKDDRLWGISKAGIHVWNKEHELVYEKCLNKFVYVPDKKELKNRNKQQEHEQEGEKQQTTEKNKVEDNEKKKKKVKEQKKKKKKKGKKKKKKDLEV